MFLPRIHLQQHTVKADVSGVGWFRSRIAREIGECPRNNLCCWARATSDVPYLFATSSPIRRSRTSCPVRKRYGGQRIEGRDVSACRSGSLSCRRQTRRLWFLRVVGKRFRRSIPEKKGGEEGKRGEMCHIGGCWKFPFAAFRGDDVTVKRYFWKRWPYVSDRFPTWNDRRRLVKATLRIEVPKMAFTVF